jgi:hypothetical protein
MISRYLSLIALFLAALSAKTKSIAALAADEKNTWVFEGIF